MRHIRQAKSAAQSLAACLLQVLAACGTNTIPTSSGGTQAPGTIELNQQTASDDALFGGGGNGTVFFNGKAYRFAIGGLGVDGSAVAILQTTGEAYQLGAIAQFPGTYRQASDGVPRPAQDTSGLWNPERARRDHSSQAPAAGPYSGASRRCRACRPGSVAAA